MPLLVSKDPIKKKKGMQTEAIVTPKALNQCSIGMFVIPKAEVTRVNSKKKIET
jgi:hypothetical protein